MEILWNQLDYFPTLWWQVSFFTATVLTLLIAVIPSHADPTRFINDKLKNAVTFFTLYALLDQAYPSDRLTLWKPAVLLLFGVIIEVCQKKTGYRSFSVGEIVANGLGIVAYTATSYFGLTP